MHIILGHHGSRLNEHTIPNVKMVAAQRSATLVNLDDGETFVIYWETNNHEEEVLRYDGKTYETLIVEEETT